jgi:hypothetical protein
VEYPEVIVLHLIEGHSVATCEVLAGRPATDRLAQLGIKAEWLRNALLAGEAEARTSTYLDPPITAGIYRYSRVVRIFREQTTVEGWGFDNRRNQARTISPAREFAVIVAQGNEFTADPNAVPSNKYGKGVTVVDAVAHNEQLALDLQALLPDGVELEPKGTTAMAAGAFATWVLLYAVIDNEIRFELSQPAAMTGGFITRWSERILFTPLALDSTVMLDEPVDEYDVPVERRDRPA